MATAWCPEVSTKDGKKQNLVYGRDECQLTWDYKGAKHTCKLRQLHEGAHWCYCEMNWGLKDGVIQRTN
jgi:hypothetical protein